MGFDEIDGVAEIKDKDCWVVVVLVQPAPAAPEAVTEMDPKVAPALKVTVTEFEVVAPLKVAPVPE